MTQPSTVHAVSSESRKDYRKSYGNFMEEYNQGWIVCSCGFEKQTSGYSDDFSRSYRFLRIEHLVEVLAVEAGVVVEEPS